jgi:hypothetical protein
MKFSIRKFVYSNKTLSGFIVERLSPSNGKKLFIKDQLYRILKGAQLKPLKLNLPATPTYPNNKLNKDSVSM